MSAPDQLDQQVLHGGCLIAGAVEHGRGDALHAVDPRTGSPLEPAFPGADAEQVHRAAVAAQQAAVPFAELEPAAHAALLEDVAAAVEAAGEPIIQRAMAETGLPEPRLRGELARTTGQLRLFAEVVRHGDHRGVRIDPALPDRTPLPRPDIRQRMLPLGPVAVFGASNFPLAFSVAGGDTASALAAGCPVIVKAHEAHPGTSELVGRAISGAVERAGLHPGVFSLLHGDGPGVGQALVAEPAVQAVGFTGSRRAGLALAAAAAARPVPTPVFAEMSSVNPVIVLDGALSGDGSGSAAAATPAAAPSPSAAPTPTATPSPAVTPTPAAAAQTEALAQGLVGSVTGSAGQLCTVPGLVFVPRGTSGDLFVDAVGRALSGAAGQTMLTVVIAEHMRAGVEALRGREGVEPVGEGLPGEGPSAPAPIALSCGIDTFLADPTLQEEVFGAVTLLVRYGDDEELLTALDQLEGQLTATMHLGSGDHERARALLPMLERRAGRILANGWPTGVDVGHAMVHGGPFPATSDGRSTSVGTRAIERFLRPVAYQNLPEDLLPAPVATANPWGLARRVDGA